MLPLKLCHDAHFESVHDLPEINPIEIVTALYDLPWDSMRSQDHQLCRHRVYVKTRAHYSSIAWVWVEPRTCLP